MVKPKVYYGSKGKKELEEKVKKLNKNLKERKKVSKRKDPITLDKKNVITRAGETSSQISEQKVISRNQERKTGIEEGTIKPKEYEPKKGIAAFREKDTLAGKAVKTITSLKTTLALGTALVAMFTLGGGAAALGAGTAARSGGIAAARTAATKVLSKGASSGAARATLKLTTGQTKNIANIASTFGKSTKYITKLVERGLLKKSVNQVVAKASAKTLAIKAGKIALGFAGTDVLIEWYALDNVMSGQKFFLKDIKSGLEDGSLQPEEALAAMEESKRTREIATKKINASARYNPLLFPFRKTIMAGAKADEIAISIIEDQINNLSVGGGENPRDTELQQRKEDEEYYEEQSTKKRDTELQQRKEDEEYYEGIQKEKDKRTEEDEAKSKQDTLFYEAIRKRNRGDALTEEEKNALIERGASIT